MKKYFVLIGLFLGCLMLASGYPRTIETQILPSATSGWDESIDNWRPIAVDSNGKLITGSGADSANIASMALDINNVASNATLLPNIDANTASMALDINNVASNATLLPNIDANTAIISDSISNPLEWKVSVASVTSTVSTFTSQLSSDTRRFVAIKNRDAFKPVYLGFEDVVTVETGLPINDTLYIEAPKDVPLYFISAEEVGIILMEGGR
jgi:hypothetical protein